MYLAAAMSIKPDIYFIKADIDFFVTDIMLDKVLQSSLYFQEFEKKRKKL